MTDKTRIRIAAAVTALFVAGISAAGLAARDHRPPSAASATAPATATQTPRVAPAAGWDDDRYEHDDDDD